MTTLKYQKCQHTSLEVNWSYWRSRGGSGVSSNVLKLKLPTNLSSFNTKDVFSHEAKYNNLGEVKHATIGTQRSNDPDGNENFKKAIGFISKNNNFAHVSGLVVHFSARFCTTTMWKCLILHFMEYGNKQQRNLCLFLNLNVVPRNLTPGGFACIWQSKWVGIITIKTKRMFLRRRSHSGHVVGS